MKDNLFNTPKKIKSNVAVLKTGIKTEFWHLISEILKANIEVVSNQILTGDENETKEDIDRLRDKLRVYKDVLNTPHKLINAYEDKTTKKIDFDPYEKS